MSFCCAICIDDIEDAATLPCHHQFCKPCITKHIDMLKQQHRPAFCPLCRGYFLSTADGFVAMNHVQSYEEQIAEEFFFDDGEITPDDEEFIESEDDYISGGESEQSYIFSDDEFLDEEAEFSPVEDIFESEQ